MAHRLTHKLSPLFIVSSGRSGTTLLRGILNSTEQIYIPHESDFIARAYPFYSNNQHLQPKDYQVIITMFMKTSQKEGWGMDRKYLTKCFENASPTTFSEANETLYKAYLDAANLSDTQWGIKHPVLIASIDKIFQVFPTSKIIHIVRDGRDVNLSYQKIHQTSSEKFGPKGPLTSSLYWIDGLRRVEQNKNDQLYELRYEDLLSDPENELKQLCDFLQIPFKDELYQSYQNSSKNRSLLLDQHRNTIHSKVKDGIDSQNQQKFLTQMPKSSRFVFELIASPYLKKYDYTVEFPLLSHPILGTFRILLYTAARLFNNWRYNKRGYKIYQESVIS